MKQESPIFPREFSQDRLEQIGEELLLLNRRVRDLSNSNVRRGDNEMRMINNRKTSLVVELLLMRQKGEEGITVAHLVDRWNSSRNLIGVKLTFPSGWTVNTNVRYDREPELLELVGEFDSVKERFD